MNASFSMQTTLAAAVLALTGLVVPRGCNAQTARPATLFKAPASSSAVGKTTPRPNVLLILADDLGWSDLGCMGSEIQTPNLDSLAKGGLTFTQFYNSARCCPTRASLLTGLSPHQAGFPLMAGDLSPHAVTLPEVLGDAGYSTSMVGKWHLGDRSTPVSRGFGEFYGMLGGFNSYWQENPNFTRLPVGRPKHQYAPGGFYSTDAFTDYSIDFIDAGQKSGKPWFQYLAYQAGHFPLHAPERDIAKYEALYAQGWDKIRAARLAKQKRLRLVPQGLALTPRSVVPKNFINVQTGWADKQNPAWDSLPADRRADLARRMATYAATIDHMDQSVGRIIAHLKASGQYDNTLIFFLSDNGACAEWDPYGFDALDSPKNVLHSGAALKQIGGPDSYVSYGSGWANASNTPWRLYKHYAQEGGIRTPLLVHWPRGLTVKAGSRNEAPGMVADLMPTLVQICGARYPAQRNGQSILPFGGQSLAPFFRGAQIPTRVLCMEHEGNRMVREGNWKLVALDGQPWELYDLALDPSEMHDLANAQPERAAKMSADWETWAQNSAVKPKAEPQTVAEPIRNPQIAGKTLIIRCEVTPQAPNGVILAQGGDQRGYALYLQDGRPVFIVRQAGKLFSAAALNAPRGRFSLEAHLEKDGAMTLAVDGNIEARAQAPGVFGAQPQDELSVGQDTLSAVGSYLAPHPLRGQVQNVEVLAR